MHTSFTVAVAENGARLVILDPVAAFLDGDHSAYREQEVRAALARVKLMAEDTGAAVVLVMHLNKADGADPLRRIGNSGAFTALARSVLLFGPDPEDEEGDRGARRVLTVAKGNVRAAGRGSLLARIVERRVEAPGGEITSAALEIVSSSSVSAEDLLGSGEERTVKGAAMGWLRDLLKAEGPLAATEVRERAKAEDIAGRTLDRAKAALGVQSAKDGLDGAWAWSLPHVGDVGVLGVLPVVTGPEGWRPSKDAWQGCQERQGRQGVARALAREGAPLLVDVVGSDEAVVQKFIETFGAVEVE